MTASLCQMVQLLAKALRILSLFVFGTAGEFYIFYWGEL